ncbi:polysaccharide biosynthesis/export family protein [Fulvivirga lutea]|uniref:Polysaccharide biosynthesis/export family protein n=1 Tax=Fulvivirga lutea TaxID=2810512 RepID=A0A974WG41_9BACT|nr:polysaccharide biosynthesis/export family protein [Fulvivirga lutea]QSE97410.1 polysaccharide biosynthesis/export family protein [Fulvivirga lutea]
MRLFLFIIIPTIIVLSSSCGSYKQNILLKSDNSSDFVNKLSSSDSNRIIEIGDYLELEVFTKYGEKVIDPDYELVSDNLNAEKLRPKLKYLVRNDGSVKLPMVGDVYLEGKSVNSAEEFLQMKFETYYHHPFVKLRILNKRVIVLGASEGQVVPLENEKTTLAEVLALSQGITNNSKAHNLKVVRGSEVLLIDLTTIEGFQNGNILVEPGDVIYIEPIRRPFTEFMRDNGPILSVATSLISLIAVLISIN